MLVSFLAFAVASQVQFGTVTVVSAKVADREYRLFSAPTVDIFWTVEKPAEECAFAVAGTFTAPDGKVDGCFVRSGTVGRSECQPWDGLVVFGKRQAIHVFDARKIEFAVPRDLERFAKRDMDLFQAMLLVSEGMAQPYDVPAKVSRRALTDDGVIIESLSDLTLDQFAKDLVELEVRDAVLLDMGPPGLGWYLTHDGKRVQIGTRQGKQVGLTNWLTFGNAKNKVCSKAMSRVHRIGDAQSERRIGGSPFDDL